MKYSVELYDYTHEPIVVGYFEANSVEDAAKKLSCEPSLAEDTGKTHYLLPESIASEAIIVTFRELPQEIFSLADLAHLYKKAEEQWDAMPDDF